MAPGLSFGSDRTPHRSSNGSRGTCHASAPVIPACRRDTVDPHQKTMMVQSFVAAFAKAARVSDVPEEAIVSDTREPSCGHFDRAIKADIDMSAREGLHGADARRRLQPHPRSGPPSASFEVPLVKFIHVLAWER